MVGLFSGRQPIYLVKDVDILRQITIKDFDNFEDHDALVDSRNDTLLGNTLILLDGQKWRDMRQTLSPGKMNIHKFICFISYTFCLSIFLYIGYSIYWQ